jgi:FkbM family methyltransferase
MLQRLRYKWSALVKSFAFDNPFQIIFSHLFYPSGYHLYIWHGNPLIVDGRRGETAGGVHAVLATDEYRQFLSRLNLTGPLNIMDLGANVGSFSVLAADYPGDIRRIVIVEGDATILPRLEFNIKSRLGPESADILHAAVCGHDGEISFFQNPTSVGSGVADFSQDGNAVETSVKAVSLSTLLGMFPSGEWIDVCKMDIEGSEFPAIYSLKDSELQRIRFLVLELHGKPEEDDAFIEYMISKGFEHWPSSALGNPRTHGFHQSKKIESTIQRHSV